MKSLHAAIDQASRYFRALSAPCLGAFLMLSGNAILGAPLTLHPTNSHYFLYHGRPQVLITSGEHYGAVLNLDFNYIKYLDTLQSNKLNLTRTFTGAYYEPSGAFNIAQNTLAPTADRFICPWAKTNAPNGTTVKYDLTKWNPAYFIRLRDFAAQAERRGIIVEMNLFCPFYDESQWEISPMNAKNNVNGLGGIARTNVYTLDNNGGLLAIQESMVRQIVTSLKDFDNVYYEICNEPYFGGVTLDWQHHIADVIVETEKKLGRTHLISQNIANDKAKVEDPHPAVSIFNFHYATPPATVAMNYSLNKVIGDNETGFKGTNDFTYRREGWDFIMAGGALYNNLDYSFTVGHEDGTFAYPANQPGGGSPALRRQLMYLQEFIHTFDFVKMRPANGVIKGGVPAGATARVLAEPGKAYALYLQGGTRAPELRLDLPPGAYRVAWFNPSAGTEEMPQTIEHHGGVATLVVPVYKDDIALKLVNLTPVKKAPVPPPAPLKPGVVKPLKKPVRK
jgi:hypothetical protein